MPGIKDLLRTIFDRLGFQVIRASRSQPVAQLTGVRNVLNHPPGPSRAGMENLGHACLALQLEWLLRDFQIDCILDVGANNGQFAAELRDLGYRGRIASFEPMAACVATLRRKAVADRRWSVFPFGLGSAPENRVLTHFADSSFNSLHAITADARAEFGGFVEETGSEDIELRTLDEAWAEAVEAHGSRRVLLKLDTQGHDLEVLKGAPRHLADCAVVLSEASLAAIYADSPSYHLLFGFLEERGFECSGVNALSYRADRPALIEVNAVFINAKVARQAAEARGRHPAAFKA